MSTVHTHAFLSTFQSLDALTSDSRLWCGLLRNHKSQFLLTVNYKLRKSYMSVGKTTRCTKRAANKTKLWSLQCICARHSKLFCFSRKQHRRLVCLSLNNFVSTACYRAVGDYFDESDDFISKNPKKMKKKKLYFTVISLEFHTADCMCLCVYSR